MLKTKPLSKRVRIEKGKSSIDTIFGKGSTTKEARVARESA